MFLTRESITLAREIKQNHSKFQLRNLFEKNFCFAEQQDKYTFGSGYKLALNGSIAITILSGNAGTDDGKIDIKEISWIFSHCNLSLIQQNF